MPKYGEENIQGQRNRKYFAKIQMYVTVILSETWKDSLRILVLSLLYKGCNRRKGPNFGRVFLM